MQLKALVVVISMVATAPVSRALADLSACDPYRTPAQAVQLKNCERIVSSSSLVPNKRALLYTLKYLNANRGSIADPSCAQADLRTNGLAGCRTPECAQAGIQNGCSFILNDMKRPWTKRGETGQNRSTGFFVDLCATNPSEVVKTFAINGGKTTDKIDRDTSDSVLAGAFKLDGEIRYDFVAYNEADYAGIRSRFNGGVPVIRLLGLNSSNNNAEWDRPMHVSAYNRGLGCPGVEESSYPIMQKVTSQGTALLMNYFGPEYEQRGNSCVNEPGATPATGGSTGSTPRGRPGTTLIRPSNK